MIYDCFSAGAGQDTKNYLEHMIIESSSNPKTSIIQSILQQFSKEKAKAFDDSLTPDDKHRLNSLVSLRNDVAHGRSINSSINNVSDALKAGITVLEKLEQALSMH